MSEPTIFIVDDDPGVRDSLSLLLGLHGYRTALFARAEDFLHVVKADMQGCALVDMRMADIGGLELQRKLASAGIALPVILITGHGNLAAARTAFKAGAVDFLTKPLSESELLDAIRSALGGSSTRNTGVLAAANAAKARVETLSTREREVLWLLASGLSSREVGIRLKIAHRTVETYKRRMMERLNLARLPDLIQLAALATHIDKAS